MKDGGVIGPCGPCHSIDRTVPRAGVSGDAAAAAGLRVEVDRPPTGFPISRAQKAGGEAITTSCPLCAFNLDNRQKEISAAHPEFKQIPVFYFSQLMALAFGLGEEECMFQANYVDPRPLLKSKNLL